MWNNGWFLWIVFILLAVLAGGFSENRKQRSASGTVDKISFNRISVRTDAGTSQVFKIDPSRQPDFSAKNIAKGDQIVLSFNRSTRQIIEVNKMKKDGLVDHPVFLSNPPVSKIKFTQMGTE